MVGAGFSRNATRPLPLSPLPPLWVDFCKTMSSQLYPNGGGPTDPLRLAQEYKVALGDTALDNLLREKIQDDQWLPGSLHAKLLELPWTEVLTTNWDRLLERAATSCSEREYEVVLTSADIARKRSPRIVKLHGSLPSHTPLIFTEDDYRNYPQTHAPFVNLARQVLFENELCLLGFSGDDPNFLQWSGWVRDELGGGQRRIYLVGVLWLSSSNRRLLESRGVIPIDLSPLVASLDKDIQHQRATGLFLKFLAECRPKPAHAWPSKEEQVFSEDEKHFGIPFQKPYPALPQRLSQPQQCVEPLKAFITKWQQERNSYPGWLVLPNEIQFSLLLNTSDVVFGLKDVIPLLDDKERGRAIFEIAWRLDTSFSRFNSAFVKLIENAIVGEFALGLSMSERLYLAATLLRTARENNDETAFVRWRKWIEAEASEKHEYVELLARCQYEVCLLARDTLDFPGLAVCIKNIVGNDPIWAMRRAALYCELCDFDSAKFEVSKAFHHLKEISLHNRRSIWVISRQAWVHFIASVISRFFDDADEFVLLENEWPTKYMTIKCDPWHELQNIENKIQKEIMREDNARNPKKPRFDAGSSSNNIVMFSSNSLLGDSEYQLIRLLDEVGIPLRFGFVNIIGKRFTHIFKRYALNNVPAILHTIRHLSESDKDVVIEKFSRVSIAKMPIEFILPTVGKLSEAIKFGIHRLKKISKGSVGESLDDDWNKKVAYLINVLSHFVCRLPSEHAQQQFSIACQYAADSRIDDWQLFEPLGNLLRRSFEAISPHHRSSLALDILLFPLPSQLRRSLKDSDWPELTDYSIQMQIVRPQHDHSWNSRVDELIRAVRPGIEEQRVAAICRLLFLLDNDALHDEEKKQLGEILWKDRKDNQCFPEISGLSPSIFLKLPAPTDVNVFNLFRKNYFEMDLWLRSPPELFFSAIADAGNGLGGQVDCCHPSEEQAINILISILNYEAPRKTRITENMHFEINDIIGRALTYSILPPINKMEDSLKNGFFDWINSNECSSGIRALPHLIRISPEITANAVDLLRRRLLSRKESDIKNSIWAVFDWIRLSESNLLSMPASELVRTIVGIVVNRRHPCLFLVIDLATKLVQKNFIDVSERKNLIQGLDDLKFETAYETWDEQHNQTYVLTLLRKSCFHLSCALRDAGHQDQTVQDWISIGENDPMPEVRYGK